MVSVTKADLTNAENALVAASTQVERAEDQLAEVLKDSDVTLEEIKEADGEDEVAALLVKANVDPDQVQFLKDLYASSAKAYADAEDAVNDAQAVYASAINPPKEGSTTTAVVIIAVVLIFVVIGGAYYWVSKSTSGPATPPQASFENPMYDSQPAGARTFMDTSAAQASSGYMDLPAAAAPAAGAQSSGYMDVSANAATNEGGEGFSDSDDEEV